MTCRATIQVGGDTIECENDAPCGDHEAFWPPGPRDDAYWDPAAAVQWNDSAPGASPHVDPAPTYEVRDLRHFVEVWCRDGSDGPWVVASFNRMHHPDPQGAAEAEAARLTCHGDGECCSKCCKVAAGFREQRDQACAEVDRLEAADARHYDAWKADQAAWKRDRDSRVQAEVNLVDAEARAERFREALEKIANTDGCMAGVTASRVLDGGQA